MALGESVDLTGLRFLTRELGIMILHRVEVSTKWDVVRRGCGDP